jgi:hypothetical protein
MTERAFSLRRPLLRLGALAALGLLVLLGLDALLWRITTEKLADGFNRWAAQAASQGLVVSAGRLERAGFPASARLVIHDLKLAGAAEGTLGGMSASLPALTLEIRLASPRTLEAEPSGALTLAAQGMPSLSLKAEEARLTHDLAPHAPYHFSAQKLAAFMSEAPQEGEVRAEALDLAVSEPAGDPSSLSLTGEARSVALPAALTAPLPGRIGTIRLEVALTPRVGLDLADPAAALRAFRDASGKAALKLRLEDWGGIALSLEGSFGLDARLLPEGDGALHLVDPDRAIDAATAAGLVSEEAGRALHALSGLLARRSPGAPPVLDIPLGLHGGVISVSGIPLIPLAPE